MKDRIIAAIALLAGVASDVRPGGQSEIQFKQALIELQGAVDTPEPEKMIQAAETLSNLLAEHIGELFGDAVRGVHEKLDGMSDKLDGLEDHMAAFMEVHVDAPEQEPAPAPTADEVAAAQAVIDAAAAAPAAA